MEEIVTVDGRQFKLTVDRPLNATEKAQVLTEIRKQTGCGTCGPRVANMGNDWQYGGIYGLTVPQTPSAGTCASGKKSLDPVTLSIRPMGGVGPYDVWFYLKHSNTETGTLITTTRLVGGLSNPILSTTEGITVSRTYTLDDDDISAAIGDSGAYTPSDVDASGALSFNTAAALTLSAANLRFITAISDSCAGGSGPGTCVQWCDVSLICIAPTCNFVVT